MQFFGVVTASLLCLVGISAAQCVDRCPTLGAVCLITCTVRIPAKRLG